MKKILVVDDTPTNITILVGLLSGIYEIIVATSGQNGLKILEDEKNISLILLDVMMPDMDGFEVCKEIKDNPYTKNIPVIFITANTDEDSIEKAYDIGGSDYITKPFKPKELLAKINREFQLQDMISHLEYISSYDQMTGVLNRRKFFELATYKYKNTKNNLYAIIIDIDKFKDINDTYGHPFGDKAIKFVATTIQSQLNENTIFGRIGGEEFAVLVDMATIEDIKHHLEDIRKGIENKIIKTDDNIDVRLTVSLGVAKKDPTISDIDHLLKKADDALYEAKGSGRNKVIFRV